MTLRELRVSFNQQTAFDQTERPFPQRSALRVRINLRMGVFPPFSPCRTVVR